MWNVEEDSRLTKEKLYVMVNEMLLLSKKQCVARDIVDTMYDWPDFGPRDPYMIEIYDTLF